jgi:NADH:ubiquinone oxidoreductase subunit 6 (subunit J)
MSHTLFSQSAPRVLGGQLGAFLAEFWPVLVPALLGLAALYLLVPRVRRYPPLLGIGLGTVSLVLAGVLLVRATPDVVETGLFYAFSAVAIVGGALLITHHNPVYAALAFALVVLSTCGLFLLLAAPFLMAATVIIYAGAIIVTFLFVIMLAQQAGLDSADLRSREPFLATLAGFLLLAALLCVLRRNYDTSPLHPNRALEPYLARVRQAAGAGSEAGIRQALDGNPDTFLKRFANAVEPESDETGKNDTPRHRLVHAIREAEVAVNSPTLDMVAVRTKLREINARGRDVLATQGTFAPAVDPKLLSPFSGARPRLEAPAVALPAENVAGLGKSLFTDYLLAVELAGTLLLVATIGAIAIAGRRAEGLR